MRVNKPNVTQEQIEQARRLDLLSYLEKHQPQELVKVAPGVFSTRSHDSLKISNGKWFRWSRGYGGASALDYLVQVREMDFVQAVSYLCGIEGYSPPSSEPVQAPPPKKPFRLPPANKNNERVTRYLLSRGIHISLIRACINTGRLYEDTNHNCVFVGFDGGNRPAFAFIRSSDPNSTFMHEVSGSNKQFSFSLPIQKNSNTLYVYESAIDALSHVTLEYMRLSRWKLDNHLALSGLYQPRKNIGDTPLPISFSQFLHDNTQIKRIYLCFDNDRAGALAAEAIIARMGCKYEIQYTPPAHGKDYNKMLMEEKGLSGVRTRKSAQQKNHNQEEITR